MCLAVTCLAAEIHGIAVGRDFFFTYFLVKTFGEFVSGHCDERSGMGDRDVCWRRSRRCSRKSERDSAAEGTWLDDGGEYVIGDGPRAYLVLLLTDLSESYGVSDI